MFKYRVVKNGLGEFFLEQYGIISISMRGNICEGWLSLNEEKYSTLNKAEHSLKVYLKEKKTREELLKLQKQRIEIKRFEE